MSDDDDYMSDKFLLGTEQCNTSSLARRPADKRELNLLKRKTEIDAKLKQKNVSVRVREQESRDKGLASAITSDNKGYKLLEKMGYTPGQGIGKKESGISEPIPFDLKTNRLGLGRESRRKQLTANKIGKPKEERLNLDDFRGRMSKRKTEQMIEIDLRKSQKSCEQLDAKNGIKIPQEIWFWPMIEEEKNEESEEAESEDEKEEEEEEDKEEDDSTSTNEKLEILTKYLRDKYFYCIWCGAKYDDDDDLRDNCPGRTRDEH